MRGWLYLIRNRDLYKIGITKNFENRMLQLKPDNVVIKLYTSDFLKLEKELHNRYKKFRIPQTEYYRLDEYHIREIRKRISLLEFPMTLILEIFIKSLFFTLLIFFILFLFLFLHVNDIYVIILKSILLMERITFGYSFLTLFIQSGKYLSFLSELKYRLLRLIVFIIFAFFFRIAFVSLQ